MADHGDYGVFLRRTIGHGIDGGGAGSAAAIPPSIAPAIRVETSGGDSVGPGAPGWGDGGGRGDQGCAACGMDWHSRMNIPEAF